MTKRHDAIFDAVLSGTPADREKRDDKGKAGARFLKRGNAISERLSGEQEEKVLHWVDPARCRLWERHNRDYALLNEENCRDLIDGIRSQGRQEFPAIVRRVSEGTHADYEVICGARRHFAISWLRANAYPNFKYLVEVRDLTDEEAFRLSDIENRDREDISDYERAIDYAKAIDLYYGGRQKAMAERLEVSEVWLSRYLELSRLPSVIVQAFPTVRDIRELHARTLKPLLKNPKERAKILEHAREIGVLQEAARKGQGGFVEPQKVVADLKACVSSGTGRKLMATEYRGGPKAKPILHSRQGQKQRLEFAKDISREDLLAAFDAFVKASY
ncbi:MAG: ParB/RepB/Spo0J family partition protein [Pseudomonadota bacterium]